jgi:hypothetical protein
MAKKYRRNKSSRIENKKIPCQECLILPICRLKTEIHCNLLINFCYESGVCDKETEKEILKYVSCCKVIKSG